MMTGKNATNLLADLHTVNELAAKYLNEGMLSFDEKLRMMTFFKNYGDIGSIYIQEDISLGDISDSTFTPKVAKGLYKETLTFLNLYKENRRYFDVFEVKTDCDNYLAPLIKKWEMSDEHSQKVHHEYLALDHRIDYMDERDSDYEELRKKCYELFDKQKEASKIAQYARIELEKARRRLYGLENLNFKWLYLLACQIFDTIIVIFPDIADIKEEEGI